MLVFLDRQHSGQIRRLDSLGAVSDLDGDGVQEIEEAEAIWTGFLSMEIEKALRNLNYKVIPISDGSYQERHDRVNKMSAQYEGPQVYLALHFNAGGGNYGSMFYDHRSGAGADLASYICDSLEDLAGMEITKKIPCSPADWTKNAYYTIKGVGRPVAICSEPAFIDFPGHEKYFTAEGIVQLGFAIAAGIHKWRRGL